MTMSAATTKAPLPQTGVVSGPILVFSIDNGAAHRRAAEAIVAAWSDLARPLPARVIEVSEFMSPFARFTHVTAYLWLVRNMPSVWARIDSYQRRQPRTSPEWFYRRECRRLFEYVREVRPSALVATEVGCLEVAALIKRDLCPGTPLVAVNLDYEADKAWVKEEVDLYCIATNLIEEDLIAKGADIQKIRVWGVPVDARFSIPDESVRPMIRARVYERLKLDTSQPMVLVSGGGEGMGDIEEIVKRLAGARVQFVAIAGRNARLKRRLEQCVQGTNGRILGWVDDVAELMLASDLLISKQGLTFYEAMACGLPIIGMRPPPGSELAQYNVLESLGVGIPLENVSDVALVVDGLLSDPIRLDSMRTRSLKVGKFRSEAKLAAWLDEQVDLSSDAGNNQ